MWTITFKSITIFLLISLVWVFGTIELIDTFSNISTQWYWLVIALIYTSSLNDIFGHMILTHRTFMVNVQSIGYKLISFLSILLNTLTASLVYISFKSTVPFGIIVKNPVYIK